MISVTDIEKYSDSRGYLSPVWKKGDKDYPEFVEDRLSVSKKYVLRGLHGDFTTGKLFIPVRGRFEFFAQEMNGSDSIFIELNSEKPQAVYVPPGYVNGHLCLGDRDNILLYKWTRYYDGPEGQVTVAWNDPILNVPWSTAAPVLSDRDKLADSYEDTINKFYSGRL
jgi:dTDP-4-dehydrorhamnose 3,5-epimerase-like enzyme